MTIKNINTFTEWRFDVINPENNQVFTIPIDGKKSKSIQELTSLVVSQMAEFDRISNNEYTKKAREEAVKLDISFPAYVQKLIHHQICRKGLADCYSNGVGDDIHKLFGGLDGIVAKLPTPLRRAAEAVTKVITGGQKKLGGCSACGGTKTFEPSKNNLGRAGTVNRVTKGKK